MQPNPALKALGFSNDTRLVIIHADDIGMCHSSNVAYADLVDFGLISSAAVMVPSPWFPEIAAYARLHPDIDLGVHLTLTSEWEKYRWGPISTRDPASGLLDQEGYFYHLPEEVQQKGDVAAVQVEIEAQLSRALQGGIQATHFDSHMFALGHPNFIMSYFQLGIQYHMPFLFLRTDVSGWSKYNLPDDITQMAVSFGHAMEEQGYPLVDEVVELPLYEPEDRLDMAKGFIGKIKPGITFFMIHPAVDAPELRGIAPDWACRVADYRVFTDPVMRAFIRQSRVQVIGYRELRKLIKPSSG